MSGSKVDISDDEFNANVERIQAELAELIRLGKEQDEHCKQLKAENRLDVHSVNIVAEYQEQVNAKQRELLDYKMMNRTEQYFQEIHDNVHKVVVNNFIAGAINEANTRQQFWFGHLHSIIEMQAEELAVLHALEVFFFHDMMTPERVDRIRTKLLEVRQKAQQHADNARTVGQTRGNTTEAQENAVAKYTPNEQQQIEALKSTTANTLDISSFLNK